MSYALMLSPHPREVQLLTSEPYNWSLGELGQAGTSVASEGRLGFSDAHIRGLPLIFSPFLQV